MDANAGSAPQSPPDAETSPMTANHSKPERLKDSLTLGDTPLIGSPGVEKATNYVASRVNSTFQIVVTIDY